MRKLSMFNFMTMNGYYKGPGGDIGWHPHGDEEEAEFAREGAGGGNTLLFGRVTYEMMARVWPTPEAIKSMPEVAEGMNKADKIVFSMTLQKADWNNTRLIKDPMVEAVRKMKQLPGKDMTILGSGSIVTQLTEAGLIDEYQFMVDPVALGAGTTLFQSMRSPLQLKLTSSRTFKSGTVLLNYVPAR